MTEIIGQRARASICGTRAGRIAVVTAALGASALAVATGYHHHRSNAGFAGPLFGLGASERGKLLVADA